MASALLRQFQFTMTVLEFGRGYDNNEKTPCMEHLLLCAVAEMQGIMIC
jgi:hypothetical protein